MSTGQKQGKKLNYDILKMFSQKIFIFLTALRAIDINFVFF